VLDEVALLVRELLPVLVVRGEVDLLRVQKEASCFLYISQISGYLMGNITQRPGLS